MPKYALIDDTHPDLVYTGTWEALTAPLNPNAPEFNRTVHATVDPNATVSYNFYGSIINFFGSINAPAIHGYPSPIFQLEPNAYPPTIFNSTGTVSIIPDKNANVATPNIKMFASGKFPEANYTMVVQAGGGGGSTTGGGGATFYFDFLAIQVGDDTFAEYVILDDTSDQFHYSDGWTTGNMTGDYLSSIHRPPSTGGVATTAFHGTEISVYGTIDGPYSEDTPIGYFKIDGGPTHTVLAGNITKEALLANGTEVLNQLIWSTTGLRDIGQGQHTLTISAPPSVDTSTSSSSSSSSIPADSDSASDSASATPAPTPTNPPWFLDYVVYGPSSALTTRAIATPTPSSSSTTTTSFSSSPPPQAGTIAGGVIGGLAGLTLLLVGFLLCRRRRHRNRLAAVEVQDEFKTNYATSTAASRPTLSGWRSSIHKSRGGGGSGSRGRGVGGVGGGMAEGSGPVLDISHTSALESLSGRVGTSTMTGPGTADSAYDTEYTAYAAYAPATRRPFPRPVREMDGGVRLASGSDIDSDVVEVLPPSYARYSQA